MEKKFTTEDAKAIGNRLGLDWKQIDIKQFRRGLEVETEEHGSSDEETNVTRDDPVITGKIVWAHLKEHKDYYSKLDKMGIS